MDAAYNIWRWYTANMICSRSTVPKDRFIEHVGRKIIQDLEPLIGARRTDTKTLEGGVQTALDHICVVLECMLRSPSKRWLAWKPDDCADAAGFTVSSATDEGWNVMMEPMDTITWPHSKDRKKELLNGDVVHLVVRPALLVTLYYEGEPSYHYAAPMSVIVDDHLAPNDERSTQQGKGEELL